MNRLSEVLSSKQGKAFPTLWNVKKLQHEVDHAFHDDEDTVGQVGISIYLYYFKTAKTLDDSLFSVTYSCMKASSPPLSPFIYRNFSV